jgi:acetyl-CoA carboxylase beta subunit
MAPELERNLDGLPQVRAPHADSGAEALEHLFDAATTTELDASLEPVDALKFKDQRSTPTGSRPRRSRPARRTR